VARLQLEVVPRDATVWIDGRPVARVPPGGLPLPPGTVRLAAEQLGYTRLSLEVTLAPGEHRHVTLALAPAAPAAAEGAPPAATRASLTLGPPAPAPPRPVYKQGWFWGVVAGGVAIGAGVTALGIVYGSHDRYPTPTLGAMPGN
jgi:hypothetical protein